MTEFNPTDGGYSEIVSVDDDSLGSVESKKFILNIDSSIFSAEIYTLNYINNLFQSLQKICENCQSITISAKNYFSRNNEISEIPQPEIIDFDFSVSTDTTVALAQEIQGYQTGSVRVNSGTLNFRDEPSTSGTILASLVNSTPLIIIGQEANSDWLKVRTEDGQEGYVNSKYVNISSPSQSTETVTTESASTNNKDYNTQTKTLSSVSSSDSSTNFSNTGSESNSGIVNITSGTLNVRSGAGTNSNVIGSLNKGDSITILGKSESNPNWLKIKTEDGQEGYVYSDYISSTNQSTTSQATSFSSNSESNIGTVDITSGTLNVRSGAGTNTNIIGSLNKGDSVTVLGESESNPNWLKIKTEDGQDAYVYKKYIDRG